MILILVGGCLLTVGCQTKEQKNASALQKCQQLLDSDNLNGATTCYGELVLANPDNSGDISQAGKLAFFEKCVGYKKKKDYKNAIICFDGFTALDPKMANNYFQLADSYYQYFNEDAKATGKKDLELLDRAEVSLKSGLKINPEDATAYALQGEILKEKTDFIRSLISHNKAVELAPNTGIFWIQLGDVQVYLLQDEQALRSYKQAVTIDPKDTTALYFLGLQYERMKRFDDAKEVYEKILKIEPDDEEILQKLKQLKNSKEEKPNIEPKQKAKGA